MLIEEKQGENQAATIAHLMRSSHYYKLCLYLKYLAKLRNEIPKSLPLLNDCVAASCYELKITGSCCYRTYFLDSHMGAGYDDVRLINSS